MNKAVKYLVDHGLNNLVLNASDGTKPEDFVYASDIMIEFMRKTIDHPTHADLGKAIENHEKVYHRVLRGNAEYVRNPMPPEAADRRRYKHERRVGGGNRRATYNGGRRKGGERRGRHTT